MNNSMNKIDSDNEYTFDDNEYTFNDYEQMYMSDELCKFLKVPLNSKHSLKEINKKVLKYIKQNQLYCLQNGRKFYLDENLKNITTDCSEMSYFQLNHYLFKNLKKNK